MPNLPASEVTSVFRFVTHPAHTGCTFQYKGKLWVGPLQSDRGRTLSSPKTALIRKHTTNLTNCRSGCHLLCLPRGSGEAGLSLVAEPEETAGFVIPSFLLLPGASLLAWPQEASFCSTTTSTGGTTSTKPATDGDGWAQPRPPGSATPPGLSHAPQPQHSKCPEQLSRRNSYHIRM